jgi:hypothetical protein
MIPRIQPKPPPDDLELARRIARGDSSAFEPVMRRHNQMLYRLARSILKDDAEAEDAVQEAYLSAFRHCASFRADSALSTWLARIVINEALGRLPQKTRFEGVARRLPLGRAIERRGCDVVRWLIGNDRSAGSRSDAPNCASCSNAGSTTSRAIPHRVQACARCRAVGGRDGPPGHSGRDRALAGFRGALLRESGARNRRRNDQRVRL